jgi:hypothetical protein
MLGTRRHYPVLLRLVSSMQVPRFALHFHHFLRLAPLRVLMFRTLFGWQVSNIRTYPKLSTHNGICAAAADN